MGFLSDVVLAGISGGASKSADKRALNLFKKGKSPEQKRVIDFFLDVKSGCNSNGCRNFMSGSSIKKMTMDGYLDLVQTKCNALGSKERAIAKIGLDESQIQEIAPIMLASFVYDDDVLLKVENQVAVSTQYSITWIFFSETQIYTYKYIFDTTSDDTWEITNDFFYTDVTCLMNILLIALKVEKMKLLILEISLID